MTDAGIEETEVVVDLGDGADGRARVATAALLVDRDRRGEAIDVVDVRFFHLPEKLAGIGRQGLDVAALTLGKDRIERQGALAGTRQTGEDDELVTGDIDVD